MQPYDLKIMLRAPKKTTIDLSSGIIPITKFRVSKQWDSRSKMLARGLLKALRQTILIEKFQPKPYPKDQAKLGSKLGKLEFSRQRWFLLIVAIFNSTMNCGFYK